jgi:hypothetical protein
MSKKTIIILIIVVAIIAVIIYFSMKKKSGAGKETTTSTSTTSGLAGLNLGGMFSGLLGGKKDPAPQNGGELLTPGSSSFLYGE